MNDEKFSSFIIYTSNVCKVSALLLAMFGYFVQLKFDFSGNLVSHKCHIFDLKA